MFTSPSDLHIDFETRSRIDLKERGLDVYANDKSTEVQCLCYAFGDGAIHLWTPFSGQIPADIKAHVDAGGTVVAHNANFEFAVWNAVLTRAGWPRLKIEQMRCTMAMCYAMALPGALEDAASALGIDQRKDIKGHRIMLQLCKPKADGTFHEYFSDKEKFEALYAYCRQDVAVERELYKRLPKLSPDEQRLWELDYAINARGVQVDLPRIEQALVVVAEEKARLDQRMRDLTDGAVGACTEATRLVKWLQTLGVNIDSVAKADVLDALKDEGLPSVAREALTLRREAAKASVAKLSAMKNRAGEDGRVRFTHQFHGAGTGRWAGRGIQTQNLPRGNLKPEQVEDAIAHLNDPIYLDILYGQPLTVVSSCLRGMITAAVGNDLLACDFSNIEGRVNAWLAGEEWKLQAFRDFDAIPETDKEAKALADIYVLSYAQAFGLTPAEAKPHRQLGKVQELALGYGGGVGAFQSMAKVYNVTVADEKADELKAAWRQAHPCIVQYWYDLEDAAIRAVTMGGKYTAGPRGREVIFKKSGSFLFCKLPSGRVLCYAYPEIRTVTTPWGADKEALTFMAVIDDNIRRKGKVLDDLRAKGKWQRISTFGGSLCENVVQAVARDMLVSAMGNLDALGYDTVMHVHDEVVLEFPESYPARTIDVVKSAMCKLPAWAAHLPLAAAGWRGKRYRKD